MVKLLIQIACRFIKILNFIKRPNKKELKAAKHHLYGFQSSGANFSTGEWLKLAEKKIRQIIKEK